MHSKYSPLFSSKEQWVAYLKQMPQYTFSDGKLSKTHSQNAIVYKQYSDKSYYEMVYLKYHNIENTKNNELDWDVISNDISSFDKLNGEKACRKWEYSFGAVVIGNHCWNFEGTPYETYPWENIIKIQPVTGAEIIAYEIQNTFRHSPYEGVWMD